MMQMHTTEASKVLIEFQIWVLEKLQSEWESIYIEQIVIEHLRWVYIKAANFCPFK